jgi:hypothetical protein
MDRFRYMNGRLVLWKESCTSTWRILATPVKSRREIGSERRQRVHSSAKGFPLPGGALKTSGQPHPSLASLKQRRHKDLPGNSRG